MHILSQKKNKVSNLGTPFKYVASLFILLAYGLSSCQTYRQNILFTTEGKVASEFVDRSVLEAESSYIIKPFDYLQIAVYTNKGERIIDPNFELVVEKMGNQAQGRPAPHYLVQVDSMVMLPIIGKVKLAGLTLPQADSLLVVAYGEYYKAPYVISRYTNKRVIVLGATGGQVIPLTNEDMSVIEIIALSGGLPNDSKGHNIRLIRGDLKNPSVQVIDLTTIEGLRKAELKVQSGDIIYIEPVRKIVSESVRDIAPLLSVITSLVTLLVLIQKF